MTGCPFQSTGWSNGHPINTLGEALFASRYQAGIKECLPRKKVQAKNKPPWRTNPPDSLIRVKQEASAKYKRAKLHSGRNSSAAVAFTLFATIYKDLRCCGVKSQVQYENGLRQVQGKILSFSTHNTSVPKALLSSQVESSVLTH